MRRREQRDPVVLGHHLVEQHVHRGRGAHVAQLVRRSEGALDQGVQLDGHPGAQPRRGDETAARGALGRGQAGPRRVGARQRPARGQQRVQDRAQAAHVVGRRDVRAGQHEGQLRAAVRGDPDPLRVVAAQHQAVPVRRLGRRGQRGHGARGGQRTDHAVGHQLGEAAAGHPLGDRGAEHVVRDPGALGGQHVEQPGAAVVLEAAGAQRADHHLAGPGGAGRVRLAADRAVLRGQLAQHGDPDVALQHGVLGPPELGSGRGVRTDPGVQPVPAGEQGAGRGHRRAGRSGRFGGLGVRWLARRRSRARPGRVLRAAWVGPPGSVGVRRGAARSTGGRRAGRSARHIAHSARPPPRARAALLKHCPFPRP